MSKPQAASTTSAIEGLSSTEAERRLARFGSNRFVEPSPGARLRELAAVVADPMALMLIAAGAIYLALGEHREGIVLLLSAVPVLGVDAVMEARSRRALHELARVTSPKARVMRDGVLGELDAELIVPGDIVLSGEGDVVHADGLVRSAANLTVDESMLTGEADPQGKTPLSGREQPDHEHRLFAGSRVLTGHGYVEVTQTGVRTRYGAIAQLTAGTQPARTPLQAKIATVVVRLAGVALLLAGAIFALRWWQGTPPSSAFLYAVSLAMSAVPEEFVLVYTLFLSLAAWRLSSHQVLVRRLDSLEAMGCTSTICLDKTGTLTQGAFFLESHSPLDAQNSERELLEASALACELGSTDPIELAILSHCREHGVDVARLHSDWALAFDYPFDPVGKHMSHVWRRRDQQSAPSAVIVAKGALEGVLAHCAISEQAMRRAEAAHEAMARQGMRILAVARRYGRLDDAPEAPAGALTGRRDHDERDLTLIGLLGFRDPLRAGVADTVAECQGAGIRLKIITGDHLMTAHAVADAAGVAHSDDALADAATIDFSQSGRLAEIAERTAVFARAQPEEKYRIVDALRAAGEIVAMTGDGINDAPALRRADIGVCMGRRGTEVAREAADLVLLNDDLGSLVSTIGEGRRVFKDIARAFLYLLAFKTMVVSVALAAPLAGLPILLLPMDLVWLELIVHPISALVFEGASRGMPVMGEPPRRPNEPIMERRQALSAIACGVLLAVGALILFLLRLERGEAYARGLAMTVIVGGSLILAVAQAGTRIFARPSRLLAIGLPLAASLPLFMAWKSVGGMFGIGPISLADGSLAVGIAAAATLWRVPLQRWLLFEGKKSGAAARGSA